MINHKRVKENKSHTSKKSKYKPSNGRIIQSALNIKNKAQMREHQALKRIKENISQISKNKLKLFSITIKTNLLKYNITKANLDARIINDIIYDEKKRIVSIFKNHLVWDESSDFLKRYYLDHESLSRIPKIALFYNEYAVLTPIYFGLDCAKMMLKNTKKKRKILDNMEERDIDASKEVVHREVRNSIISYFIKPEEVLADLTKSHQNSQSQSQISHIINKVADNNQFYPKFRGNDYTEKEISFSQYNDHSEFANNNLNDILNNLSIQNSTINIIGNIKKKNVETKKYPKAKTSHEMKKIKLEIIHQLHTLQNKNNCKTERITPSKIRKIPKKKLNNKYVPKPQMKTLENEKTSAKNICLNVLKILKIKKSNFASLSNKNEMHFQRKNRLNGLDIGNKGYKSSNKSPDKLLDDKKHKLILSNDNSPRKNGKFLSLKHELNNQPKYVKINHNTNKIKKKFTKPLLDKEELITESACQNYLSHTVSPKAFSIAKIRKTPLRDIVSSGNTAISSNIKVNLSKQISLNKIATPTSIRQRKIESAKPKSTLITSHYQRKIKDSSKENGISRYIKTEIKEREESLKYSRNSNTFLLNNFQSSSTKRKKNNGHPNKQSSFTKLNNLYIKSSTNSKNITINIKKHRYYINPSITESNSGYPSTTRNGIENTSVNLFKHGLT